jgi:hypothetical protein
MVGVLVLRVDGKMKTYKDRAVATSTRWAFPIYDRLFDSKGHSFQESDKFKCIPPTDVSV